MKGGGRREGLAREDMVRGIESERGREGEGERERERERERE